MTETLAPSEHQPLRFDSIEELRAQLDTAGYDTAQWGQGATKTLDALWEELESGESQLGMQDGHLVRSTYVAKPDIFGHFAGHRYRLVEDRQVFTNGSERRRNLDTSIAEKMRPTETPEEATRRALQEELGIDQPESVMPGEERIISKISQSYGGMPTQLYIRTATVEIRDEDFRPEGYVEVQADKSVYFVWQPVENPADSAA